MTARCNHCSHGRRCVLSGDHQGPHRYALVWADWKPAPMPQQAPVQITIIQDLKP